MKAAKEKAAREKAEAEKAERERAERERAEAELAAKARAEAEERAEQERVLQEAREKAARAANRPPPGMPDAYYRMFGTRVPMARDGERDELVNIKGIGPVTAKRLNELGIFTYRQIAAFDLATLERVIEAVGAIPARVHKDDWIGQARAKLEG